MSITLATREPTDGGVLVRRSFTNVYDDVAGTFTATDQDGNTFTTTTDDAGRIETITRFISRPGAGPWGFIAITATYTYDAAGRLTRVDHGNDTAVVRQYDAADRPTLIRHEDAGGNAMLELAYEYTADGLVKRIIETDEVSEAAAIVTNPAPPIGPILTQVDFEYDNRNRLTRETRANLSTVTDADLGAAAYDLSYTYDAGGNRMSKTDHRSGLVTTYHYDIETLDTIDNGQHNNRLLWYELNDTDPATGAPIALEQTIYTYGPAGNVLRLVKRGDDDGNGVIDQADTMAMVWWFYYDTANHLWLAVRGTGMYDESTASLSNNVFDKAAEYRYDGGQQRYLVRERDPNNSFVIVGTGQWRDYIGNDVYNDYFVDAMSGTVTDAAGHLPGIGFDDPSLANAPAYYGSDFIGTTRRVADSSTGGTGVSPVIHKSVLTAFGEPISTAGTGNSRYGFAGEWGYETPDESFDPLADLGWLHVGERYYDPSIGRFMQRDPIGIDGGLNTYVYVANNPTIFMDPTGRELGVLPNDQCESILCLGDGPLTGTDGGAPAGVGAAGGGHGKGGAEHRKGKSKRLKQKHQKGKRHSSSKMSKAKTKLIKAGKWRFRFSCMPLFIECRCGNGFINFRGPTCTCGA